jgi:prophage regulatory protein
MRDILEQLRTDAGHLTVATLIQQREAAASEIVRLREIITRLRSPQHQIERGPSARLARSGPPPSNSLPPRSSPAAHNSRSMPQYSERGALLRLKDVCSLVGVGRSTVYGWIAQRKFPQPVQVGARAVRWRVEDLDAWRATLEKRVGR